MKIVPELFVRGDRGVLLPAQIGGRKSEVLRLMEVVIVFFSFSAESLSEPVCPVKGKNYRENYKATNDNRYFFLHP